MKLNQIFQFKRWKGLFQTCFLLLLLLTLSFGQGVNNMAIAADNPPRKSTLAQGDAITDPVAILRYALPIDNDSVRSLQADLESISKDLRGKRWSAVQKSVKNAAIVLKVRRETLLEGIPESKKPEAEALLAQMGDKIIALQEAVEAKDKETVWLKRKELLSQITSLEEWMVTEFPFEIPEEYANLPQLKGRATVELKTTQGDLIVVVDGYNAPINAGNFVDLVERGFYDGLNFNRSEDFFVLQGGDPPGPEDGFINPKTKQYRAIPLEIKVKGEKAPIYGITLEDAGFYLPQPLLPFNAYGALALARPGDDPNGGSSQFFFFKFDTEMTPPGFNLMDGRYSVFGYLVEGKDILGKLTTEDKIISAKVIQGANNLVKPSF
jgi:peptidylprolyl isomerase